MKKLFIFSLLVLSLFCLSSFTNAQESFYVISVSLEELDALANEAEDMRTFHVRFSEAASLELKIFEKDSGDLFHSFSGPGKVASWTVSPDWGDKRLEPLTEYRYEIIGLNEAGDMASKEGEFKTSNYDPNHLEIENLEVISDFDSNTEIERGEAIIKWESNTRNAYCRFYHGDNANTEKMVVADLVDVDSDALNFDEYGNIIEYNGPDYYYRVKITKLADEQRYYFKVDCELNNGVRDVYTTTSFKTPAYIEELTDPDLIIEELGVKDFENIDNSGSYYYVSIKNNGADYSFDNKASLGIVFSGSDNWLGDTNEESYYMEKSFNVGDLWASEQILEFVGPSAMQAPAGDYSISVEIDSQNSIIESDETNNSNSVDISIQEVSGATLPDLQVIAIDFSADEEGKEGQLDLSIRNNGSALTSQRGLFNLYNNLNSQLFEFSEGGKTINDFKTDRDYPSEANPLGTGEIIKLSWIGRFGTYGNLYINFKVDNANELEESNENNNSFSATIEIKKSETKEGGTGYGNEEGDTGQSNTNDDKYSDDADRLRERLDEILEELDQLRDQVREQENELKYLQELTKDQAQLTMEMKNAINNFITYGVDQNTKKLGEGERAAVVFSYKDAFEKLPENEEELADAIRIANGRWPNKKSESAEKKAKKIFEKIYKKIPNMSDPRDNAAVTVMAYGLRQKAENRNLESEKAGIKTFRAIFGHHPESTEDWNTMQAITYSGAARGTDSDGDLLIDDRELEFGTDPNNPDTDGDGYGDGMEVANAYNPNGEGKLNN